MRVHCRCLLCNGSVAVLEAAGSRVCSVLSSWRRSARHVAVYANKRHGHCRLCAVHLLAFGRAVKQLLVSGGHLPAGLLLLGRFDNDRRPHVHHLPSRYLQSLADAFLGRTGECLRVLHCAKRDVSSRHGVLGSRWRRVGPRMHPLCFRHVPPISHANKLCGHHWPVPVSRFEHYVPPGFLLFPGRDCGIKPVLQAVWCRLLFSRNNGEFIFPYAAIAVPVYAERYVSCGHILRIGLHCDNRPSLLSLCSERIPHCIGLRYSHCHVLRGECVDLLAGHVLLRIGHIKHPPYLLRMPCWYLFWNWLRIIRPQRRQLSAAGNVLERVSWGHHLQLQWARVGRGRWDSRAVVG